MGACDFDIEMGERKKTCRMNTPWPVYGLIISVATFIGSIIVLVLCMNNVIQENNHVVNGTVLNVTCDTRITHVSRHRGSVTYQYVCDFIITFVYKNVTYTRTFDKSYANQLDYEKSNMNAHTVNIYILVDEDQILADIERVSTKTCIDFTMYGIIFSIIGFMWCLASLRNSW